MFALGFYWLATRHRATRPRAQTLPPAARRSAFVPRDIDEWESGAPYPDHILKAVREMERGRQGASSPSDTRHEALQPDRTRDARTQLHEGIDALTAEPPPTTSSATESPSAVPPCPRCQSSRIDTCNRARQTSRTIGSILGATSGIAVALAGAEAAAVAGIIAGPAGPIFGGLAGAIIATLFSSAAASTIGSAVGIAVDSKFLPRYQCSSCGHVFSASYR